jgi:hypothetical protein
VIRSDVGDAHRLSLSARVVSAVDRQVKAKPQGKKRLCHGRNRRNRDFETHLGRVGQSLWPWMPGKYLGESASSFVIDAPDWNEPKPQRSKESYITRVKQAESA